MDMDEGGLDWQAVEEAVAGMEQISMFGQAGDGLFGVSEL